MSDKSPIGFLVGEENPLSANAEGHQDDKQEDDEVHHVLDHSADHHHVRTEVFVHSQRSETSDVPVVMKRMS